MDFFFESRAARHSETGALVRGAQGTLHAMTDTTYATPLTYTPEGGVPRSDFFSDAYGAFPEFWVTDHERVRFRSTDGTHVQVLTSFDRVFTALDTYLDETTLEARIERTGMGMLYRVPWDPNTGSWGTRPSPLPTWAKFAIFTSFADPAATDPSSLMETGDLWWYANGGGPFV